MNAGLPQGAFAFRRQVRRRRLAPPEREDPDQPVNGYYTEDVNLDGIVKYIGVGNDRDPVLVTIGGNTPNAVRSAQLP
ncbi:MAG: hypothetical protein IPP33_06300 [Flavobacteriales bacterium]|nr:hypothetical protein [Flavobacteriales bacterium]